MGFKLNAKQLQGMELLCNDLLKIILFTGGSRTGKTTCICEYIVSRAFQYPNSTQLIVRSTNKDCMNMLFEGTFREYLRTFVGKEHYKERLKAQKIVFSNGSELHFAGLEDGEQLQKILGGEYITAFMNEATLFSLDQVTEVQTRLAQVRYDKSGRRAMCKLLMDCNPRTQTHWLYRWGVLKQNVETGEPLPDADSRAMLHWTAWDNIEHLGEAYIKTLEALPEQKKRRMLLGEWVNNEGLVFEDFDVDRNVIEPYRIPFDATIFGGVDFGFNHPFGYLQAEYDRFNDVLTIFYEYKKSKQTTAQNALVVNEFIEKSRLIPDLIFADHQIDSRKEFENVIGLKTKTAIKNQEESIDRIQQRLVPDENGVVKLRIMSHCTGLIGEIQNHQWKPESAKTGPSDQVVKLNDDLIDCLRYIVSYVDKISSASGKAKYF